MGRTGQQNTEALNDLASGKDTLAYIWAGWAGWRVVLMVFGIVFLIQGIAAFNMLHSYEAEQLAGLRAVARAALVPTVSTLDEEKPAAIEKDMFKLLRHTVIRGVAVYGMTDDGLTAKYGEMPGLRPVLDMDYARSFHARDGLYYDVIFTPGEIGQPYNIAVRLDSSGVSRNAARYAWRALAVICLMSVLITGVLMIATNQLLLAPLLKRNDSLLRKMHRQAEDKIHRLAYFDSLTGLPNRTYFLEHLDKSIEQKIYGRDGVLAVLSVDLDHFKDINDSMGHEVGDKLLDIIGGRLAKSLPEDAVVARLSADEFAVMVPLGPEDDSSALAEKVSASIQEPVEIMQESFLMRASVGVSCYPRDGETAGDILKNADIALNRAKSEGRATVRHYSQDFNEIVQQRSQMLRDLRKALDEKQLQLHYHPQFDIRTGEIVGAEALLRWFRPDNSKEGGKFISPAEFVPVAE
ncbi:MAG: diguanylate cyclase, partial [Alphaproteobacteria bacterium]|nr:diguanylate cyclase [Alphaproteobacteria bacterium]